MDFLIMIVAAVIVFGKLAAKSEGEGKKKRTQNVGPTAEEWAERLRQSAAGGEVSDKLNSAVNALKKSPRRPSGREIEAEQARRNAAERHHSEKRWAEARRQQADSLRVHAAGVDSCEGRLESLKVLYDAGILDREDTPSVSRASRLSIHTAERRADMKNVTIYTDGGVCLANPVNANSLAPCGATARMAGTRRLNGEPI